ncbi:MAG: hypothetical protein KJ072_06045 [Verrucomicrobia bacterium]|nr:hypothetical protein [Verrucomicrobiota bacterium]
MFPLPAGDWPSSVEQLRRQLFEGLRDMLRSPPRLVVTGEWPVLSELTLDLGGVRIDPATAWVRPRPVVERQEGPGCRRVRIFGAPLRWGDLDGPHFELEVSDLQFEFARDEAGHGWLMPAKVGGGSMHARITGSGLDRLFLEAVRQLAQAQGITVDEAGIRLEPAGPNAIRFVARIGARKAFLKGRVRLTGLAEIGSALELRLRELRCEGEGAIGGIGARAIQPHLDRLGQRPLRFPGSLMSDLRLQEFELRPDAGGALELVARLGPGPRCGCGE